VELIISIFIFALSSSITPGPNTVMIMSSGLNHGIKNSLPHVFGICFGFPIMVILLGLGLGFIFEKYTFLHEIIKIAGVLYLLYLAYKIATSLKASFKSKKSKAMTFVQAFIFQWLNPKAWVVAAGAISAYTNSSANIYSQVFLIAFIFFIVAFPSVFVWLIFGSKLKKVLKNTKHHRIFNYTMGFLLFLSILPIINELLLKYII